MSKSADDGVDGSVANKQRHDGVHGVTGPAAVSALASEPVTVTMENVVTYRVDDTPPWILCVLLGFQHYLTAFGSTLSVPLILAGPLCVTGDNVGLSEIVGTVFFVSGLATLLQTTIGTRLPIIQGITFAFLAPTFSILTQPQWLCPSRLNVPADNSTNNVTASESSVLLVIVDNGTTHLAELGSAEHKELWQSRMREVQGAIIVASITQITVGFSGLLSVVLRFIGPLVIAPTVTLVGLSLFEAAADKASQHWWIALTTLTLITLFSQCLNNVSIPLPHIRFTRRHGCRLSLVRVPILGLFPVLIALVFSWLLCLVLTLADVLPSDPSQWGYNARTDTRSDTLKDTAWIRVPYPGQWGVPTVSVGAVLGMVAGVLASMIESVGDYYACARLSGAPPPPAHAMNRGIGVEGVCCVLAGAFGSGNGTTSYSENVAAIGITKVASRRVVQVAGVLLVVMGCLGKVGALFVTIPEPVVGGMFLAMFAMITAVGLSNLRYVDLRRPRNMCVLGLSLFIGLSIPRWVSANKYSVNTGSSIADQIIVVLLSTSMFVGGLVGCVLDNLLPGTHEERGLRQWRMEESGEGGGGTTVETYTLPLVSACIDRLPVLGRLPFCPAPRKRTQPTSNNHAPDSADGAAITMQCITVEPDGKTF